MRSSEPEARVAEARVESARSWDYNVSDFHEYGLHSAEDIEAVLQSAKRIRRGEQERVSIEEVFAEIALDD